MDFIALDFETANTRQHPCSIGLVLVKNDTICEEFQSLIKPWGAFDSYCIRVHGICFRDVAEARIFSEIWDHIEPYFRHFPVVAHNVAFDKSVLEKSVRHYGLAMHRVTYYDTMQLFKYNYPDYSALDISSACASMGVHVENHHNALSDARSAAKLMLCMIADENTSIFPSSIGSIIEQISINQTSFDTNANDEPPEPEVVMTKARLDVIDRIDFLNSTFVLTGIFSGYSRDSLKELIISKGGRVVSAVSKKVNYVVAGLQDASVVKDHIGAKSTKILEAEALREEGINIKIIDHESLYPCFREDG